MVDATTENKCNKPGCEVSITGVCVEGHEPLAACPSYGKELIEVPIEDKESAIAEKMENKTAVQITPLSSGEALDTERMGEFLRWRPASHIAVIGDRDSGKTTFISSIYDQFLRGPFANHIFAGSWTLVALERQLHPARVESGRVHPDTAHTSMFDGLKFFHLAIIPASNPDGRIDLMLSDRAGETYKLARDDSDNVSELSEITQSDRIVLLLDGGRLANAVERAGAIQSVRQMLRAFIDGGALDSTSIVQVVVTKTDLLVDHADKEIIDAQLSQFKVRLTDDFSDALAELSFWEIAARDPKGHFDLAYGVDKLFVDWTTHQRKIVSRSRVNISLSSEFDRLLLRTPMEVLV